MIIASALIYGSSSIVVGDNLNNNLSNEANNEENETDVVNEVNEKDNGNSSVSETTKNTNMFSSASVLSTTLTSIITDSELRSLVAKALEVTETEDISSYLSSLESLTLSGATSCTSLSGLGNFKNLKVLNIENFAALTDISAVVNISTLEEIHITECSKLTSIDSLLTTSALENLKVIDITYTSISGQLNFTGSLPNLTTIILSNNKMEHCVFTNPDTAYYNLAYIDYSNNVLSYAYNFITTWNSLEYIDLSNNKIPSISFQSSHSGLKYLNLSNNSFTSYNFSSFTPNLVEVNLSNNNISTVTASSVNFPNIETVYLSNNSLKSLDSLFTSNLSNLKYLDLSNNSLESFTLNAEYPNLEYLDLSNNSLTNFYFSAYRKYINYIDISNNSITTITNDFSSEGEMTEDNYINYIDISNNSITDGDISGLSLLKNIKWINLDGNDIESNSWEGLPVNDEAYILISKADIDIREWTEYHSFWLDEDITTKRRDWTEDPNTSYVTAKSVINIKIDYVTVEDKEYDGEVAATVSSIVFVDDNGNVETLDSTQYNLASEFSDPNAGDDKDVSVIITLTSVGRYDYELENGTLSETASILPASVTFTPTVADKVYDGNDIAEVINVTFVKKSDNEEVGFTENVDYTVSAVFEDENAGDNKDVDVTVVLNNSNYELTSEVETVQATINKMGLYYTAGVSDKVYDGNTDGEVISITFIDDNSEEVEFIEGKDYTVSAVFEDENVGDNKEVIVTVTLINENYELTSETFNTTANIVKEILTIASVTVADKVYDGNENGEVTSIIFVNSSNEEITITENVDYEISAVFESADAGDNKEVIVTVTLINENYELTSSVETTQANINKMKLSYIPVVADKVYDGNTDGEVTGITFIDENNEEVEFIEGEDYTVFAVFEDENAGDNKYVIVTVTLMNENYELTSSVEITQANINKMKLSYIPVVADKVYDGNTDGEVTSITFIDENNEEVEFIEGEDYTISAVFEDENAGDNKYVIVTVNLINENYELSSNPEIVQANIIKKSISYTAEIYSKYYDGTTDATVKIITFYDLLEDIVLILGEDYEIVNAEFEDETPGSKKLVQVTINLLNTDKLKNYNLADTTIITTGSIYPVIESIDDGDSVVIFPIGEDFDLDEESDNIFSDLENHWAKDYIYDLYEKGIVSGYPDGTFVPDIKTNRGDVAVLVCNLLEYLGLNISDLDIEEANFIDLDKNKYYYSSVQQANYLDIMVGYGDETFKPGEDITREEFVMVLYKLASKGYITLGKGESREFIDYDDVSSWCKEAFDYVNKMGILTGYPDGSFNPKGDITRAELVMLLYQILN